MIHYTCRKEDIRNYLREPDEPYPDGILSHDEYAGDSGAADNNATDEKGEPASSNTSTEISANDPAAASGSSSDSGSSRKVEAFGVPAFISNV